MRVGDVVIPVTVAGLMVLASCGDGAARRPGARTTADSGATFFDRYVDGDGRVVRHDQGGDTVSEGQAYAMLLAVAAGDRDRFDRIWAWTQEHLQRSDGLLAWRWSDGRVLDESPAADADVDAARALILAGRRFAAPHLIADGKRLAAAVLEKETLKAGDRLVLAAGPWAVSRRIANPSYLAPCAFDELGEASGDSRWRTLRTSSYDLIAGLVNAGRLPPDWASVGDDGTLRPIGTPDAPDGPPHYGLDAARLPFRLAEPCHGDGNRLAAQLWKLLGASEGQGGAISYDLDGRRTVAQEHPAALVGAAAAARAAGDAETADALTNRAAKLDSEHPSYYGAAWLALGDAVARVSAGKS